MKAQKVLAAIAVTALTASIAVGLTACGPAKLGKANLSLKNYIAEENTAAYNEQKAPELKNLLTVKQSEVVSDNNGLVILNKGTDSAPSYTAYSLEYEKNVVVGAKAVPQTYYVGNETVYRIVSDNNDGTYTYKYVTLDGKEILTINDYRSFVDSGDYYYVIDSGYGWHRVDGEADTTRVSYLTVEKWSRNDGSHTTDTYYFRSVTDKKTGAVSYEVLTASQLNGSEYEVGGNYNNLSNYIYSDDEKPVEGAIKDYKISYFGDTYKFYNGATETGLVEIKNGSPLAFLDNYMYYYEMRVVDPDSKNYNYIDAEDEIKYDYSLYRYDILKDSTKKLDYNVAIFRMETLYNYATKSFDAAIISGSEMVNGFAAYGMNAFSYVVDKNLKVAFDLHGESVSVGNIVELGNGKYQFGNYIVDENVNPVNKASSSSDIYASEGLIRFNGGNGYGFTDFNGTIVIAPKYTGYDSNSNISFYGGSAHVYEMQTNGSRKEALLKPDGTVTYVEDLEKSTSDDVIKNFEAGYGYYSISTVSGSGSNVTRTIDVFTNGGTKLITFAITDVDYLAAMEMPFIKQVHEANGTYEANATYTYYKLG